ncbi:MAG: hypothetical protein ACKOPQ_16385 [Novosphingobium sp.]
MSTPVRLSVPKAGAVPSQVELVVEKDSPAGVRAFVASLGSRLTAKGVSLREGAPYRLVVTLASTPADLGTTNDAGSDPKSIAWQSRPRKGSAFDGCKPRRLRAVAVGSQGLTAEPDMKVSAELDTCKAEQPELDRLSEALATALTRG